LIKPEFLRFLSVGLANTAFSYSLYYLFNFFLTYKISYTLSYIAGIIFSYWLNNTWVFKTRMNWKTFFQFPLVYLLQYLMGIGCLHILVEKLGVSALLALPIVIVLTIPATFVLSRFLLKHQQTRI